MFWDKKCADNVIFCECYPCIGHRYGSLQLLDLHTRTNNDGCGLGRGPGPSGRGGGGVVVAKTSRI